MIGPAHPISNLRALQLGRKHNETKYEVLNIIFLTYDNDTKCVNCEETKIFFFTTENRSY